MQTFPDLVWGQFPNELLEKSDIECYYKVMELHPIYPKIWYNLALGYKQKAKDIKKRSYQKIRRKIKKD
jgi:hypothetical protein